jgi:hypothetical protein
MAILSISVQAQTDDFTNNTTCSLRIRTICIEESPSCSIVSMSQGAWVTITPSGISSIPAVSTAGCGTGYTVGYEVDYHPSTGCDGNSLFFTTNPATQCLVGMPAYLPGANEVLPQCPCNVLRPHIEVTYQYDPTNPVNFFEAN